MALIGQIAISMVANADKFKDGIKQAQKALSGFQAKVSSKAASAMSPFGSGFQASIESLKFAYGGLAGAALNAAKGVGAAFASQAAKVGKFFAPITMAAKASFDALKFVYGPIGGLVGFTRDWGKALNAVFVGPAIANIKGFGGYLKDWGKAFNMMSGGRLGSMAKGVGALASSLPRLAMGALDAARGLAGMAARATVAGVGMLGRALDSAYLRAKELGRQALTLGAVAGGAAALGLFKLLKAGSDLVENQNKLKEVFGASKGIVVDAADKMAAAFGVSRNAFEDMAGKLGGIFTGAGYAQDAAAKLSAHFAKLAIDVKSRFNIPVQDALEKLQAGLVGEIRPLRELGVAIDDEMVKAYAMKTGIAKLGQELTQNQKIQSRVGLITAKLAGVQGDMAKTANDVANASSAVWGRMENLASSIGEKLQPIARSVLGQINEGLGAMSILWNDNKTDVLNWAMGTTGASEAAAGSIGIVQSAIGGIADAWQNVRIKFMQYQLSLTGGVSWMAQNLPGFAKGINDITKGNMGIKISHGDKEVFKLGNPDGKGRGVSDEDFKKTWIEDLARLQEAQGKDLAGAIGAPKASEAINAAFAKSREQIKAAQAGIGYEDISKLKPGADPYAMAKPEKGKLEFAKAASAGSQDATNAVLRSKYGGNSKGSGSQDQTARATVSMDRKLDTLPQQIARALGTVLGGGNAGDLAMNLGKF